MAKGVVCGMNVKPEQTPWTSEYQGKTYDFCSQQCKEQFDRNPQAYVGRQAGSR
jgi:YHS domain-containing protein